MAGNQRIARLPVYVAPTKPAALTRRELQLCELIAAATPNKVIAETMGIAVETVKRHRHNALVKLGMNSSHQMIRWWLDRTMAHERSNLHRKIAELQAENAALRRQRDEWKMWCGVSE